MTVFLTKGNIKSYFWALHHLNCRCDEVSGIKKKMVSS